MKRLVFTDNWLAKLILFADYTTIMLFGFILSKLRTLSERTITHESIHQRQYVEVGLVGLVILLVIAICTGCWWCIVFAPLTFYVMYLLEYAISVVAHMFKKHTDKQMCEYYSCAFEQEAFANEQNADYLKQRKPFAFVKYYGKVCIKS